MHNDIPPTLPELTACRDSLIIQIAEISKIEISFADAGVLATAKSGLKAIQERIAEYHNEEI